LHFARNVTLPRLFYDPAEAVTRGCGDAEPEDPDLEPRTVCRGDSRTLLRLQVRDFVRWYRRRRDTTPAPRR
jgi:hypothetical protein